MVTKEPAALVVQPNHELRELWCAPLEEVGLRVQTACSAAQGRSVLEQCGNSWHSVLVDEELPDDRPLVFVEQVARVVDDSCIRILALSQLTPSRIAFSHALGFLALPRDFVPKMLQHLASLAMRAHAASTHVAGHGGIVVDPSNETVRANGRLLALTKHQRLIMKRLALTPDNVVSPNELCHFAGIQISSGHQNLHNELWRLRTRLGREAAAAIVNVRGRGYRFSRLEATESLGPRLTSTGILAARRCNSFGCLILLDRHVPGHDLGDNARCE